MIAITITFTIETLYIP